MLLPRRLPTFQAKILSPYLQEVTFTLQQQTTGSFRAEGNITQKNF
jgi:hypothetical protein